MSTDTATVTPVDLDQIFSEVARHNADTYSPKPEQGVKVAADVVDWIVYALRAFGYLKHEGEIKGVRTVLDLEIPADGGPDKTWAKIADMTRIGEHVAAAKMTDGFGSKVDQARARGSLVRNLIHALWINGQTTFTRRDIVSDILIHTWGNQVPTHLIDTIEDILDGNLMGDYDSVFFRVRDEIWEIFPGADITLDTTRRIFYTIGRGSDVKRWMRTSEPFTLFPPKN